jgi:hypothetical protein
VYRIAVAGNTHTELSKLRRLEGIYFPLARFDKIEVNHVMRLSMCRGRQH